MQQTSSTSNFNRELKKIKKVNCFKVLLFCLLAVCLIWGIGRILERKSNHDYFSKAQESMDVLFFGNSHVAYGIYPMDLWKNYGIASYNLGNNACGIPVSYWTMRYAFSVQKPSVVVVDCNTVSSGWIDPNGEYNEYLQAAMDGIPMSVLKWKATRDLCRNKINSLYYFFNFAVYHSRWEEAKLSELRDSSLYDGRGGGIWNNIAVPIPCEELDGSEELLSTVSGMGDWDYLRKIIELCQEEEVSLLLTFIPFPAQKDGLLEAKTVHSVVNWARDIYGEKCLVNYLDYDTILTEAGINFQTDCSDANSHLNGSGVHKVDRYLGAYLQAEYNLPDRRGEDGYDNWDEDWTAWTNKIGDRILASGNYNMALMMLYDAGLDYYIDVPDRSGITKGSVTDRLLEQLESGMLGREELKNMDTSCMYGIEWGDVCDEQSTILNVEESVKTSMLAENEEKNYFLRIYFWKTH